MKMKELEKILDRKSLIKVVNIQYGETYGIYSSKKQFEDEILDKEVVSIEHHVRFILINVT